MSVNLGSIVSANGQATASGLSSGLDTAGIITTLVEAREAPIADFETRIQTNSDKIDKYAEFRTILTTFQSAVDVLRNPPGVNNDNENIFQFRSSSLSSTNITDIEDFLSVTTAAGASLGEFDLVISNLAEALHTRTDAFTSRTADITEAASGSTAGLFSAGTFHFVSAGEMDTNSIDSTEIRGSGAGILATTAITNITNTDDFGLLGGFNAVAATVDGSNVDVVITLDSGVSYTADDIPANTGGGSDSIAAGTYLFSNATTGASFSLTLDSDVLIDGNQANADSFAADILADGAALSFAQSRQLTNFDAFDSSLLSSHVVLTTDQFDSSDNTFGQIQNFIVTPVTGEGNTDGEISVVINGQTFEATGLGTGTGDTHTTNITLTSTTTDDTLTLDIGDAGLTFDFSDTASAQDLEDDLNSSFGANVGRVTVAEDDSLIDIEEAINNVSGNSNVEASIVQIADNDFRLNLRSLGTGTLNAFSIIDPDGVTSEVNFNTVQAAENASITVDGVAVTRSSNSITDVVSGVTLNLLDETGGDTISVDVDRDTSAVNNGVLNFVNAYNEFRVFLAEQAERDEEGNFVETAILQTDSTITTILNSVISELNSAVSNVSDDDFGSLQSIGITLEDFAGDSETLEVNNILQLDADELAAFLNSNFNDVREVFEFQFSSDSNDLSVFARTNNVSLTDFRLVIDTTADAGEEVEVQNSSGQQLFFMDLETVGNNFIFTGQEGTALEGLELIYSGDGTDTINVELSQGIGDRLFNLLDGVLEEDDGLVDVAVDTLSDQNEDLQSEIDDLNEQIENFRQTLVLQFTALEESITQINVLLGFLETNNQSVFND